MTTSWPKRLWRAAALCLLTCAAPAWALDPAPAYTTVAPSTDGIGKRYMGREIAGVMGFAGAAWLERQEREREERTDLLLDALNLQPGMVVADVGAGTGYLARRMASVVQPGGSVWAVDVQPEMVQMLQKLAAKRGLRNIKPVLGSETDIRLPAAAVDLAIMVDVYHELAYPHEVMQSILAALKPGGRLVFVEYRAEDPKVPIKALHKMSEVQIRAEAGVHSLVWEKTIATLPWQHLVVFQKSR
jgi:precorrin-6B methylase 2